MADERLALKRTVKTVNGGWRFTDAVYNQRWLERVKRSVIVSPTGCWLWTKFINPTWGYAFTAYRNRQVGVHRKVYEVTRGMALVREQYVCHSCDVRHCVNPDHLWLGSNSENQKDSGRKLRHYESRRLYCEHGHEFTPENTYLRKSKSGGVARQCRECDRERMRRYWREQPERMRARQNAWRRARREQRASS